MQDLILTALTSDELAALIDKRLDLAFSRNLKLTNQPEAEPGQAAPPYVSKREAARLLSCSTGTIDNAARAGRIKRHYVGKAVKFLRSEVLALAKTPTNHKRGTQ